MGKIKGCGNESCEAFKKRKLLTKRQRAFAQNVEVAATCVQRLSHANAGRYQEILC